MIEMLTVMTQRRRRKFRTVLVTKTGQAVMMSRWSADRDATEEFGRELAAKLRVVYAGPRDPVPA